MVVSKGSSHEVGWVPYAGMLAQGGSENAAQHAQQPGGRGPEALESSSHQSRNGTAPRSIILAGIAERQFGRVVGCELVGTAVGRVSQQHWDVVDHPSILDAAGVDAKRQPTNLVGCPGSRQLRRRR